MPTPLNAATLASISSAATPGYDRDQVKRGIVHLGIGGFHRAHQAVYTDELLASGDLRWGITGVSLRSTSVEKRLTPQDCLYTVRTLGQDAGQARIIGAVQDVIALPNPGALATLVDRIANPATQVVTLTITEKGYTHTQKGELDEQHADVIHDLNNPNSPRSTAGVLALGLASRRAAAAGPLTILSCDNLAGNGDITRNVVTGLLARTRPEMTAWLQDYVSFPASMVDRIVPQTSETALLNFERDMGYTDLALIECETFSQWIIEDTFAADRPAWDIGGAAFVKDVVPFEQAKLRLLNATHSALAYLGLLAGYEYIHETIADPLLLVFAQSLISDEIAPMVMPPEGMDLSAYVASIMQRFGNAAVPYRTQQVATDGALKLPQRLYPTIAERLQLDLPVTKLCLVIAAWIEGLGNAGNAHPGLTFSDPAGTPALALTDKHSNADALVRAIARETDHFGNLVQSESFLLSIIEGLQKIRNRKHLSPN